MYDLGVEGHEELTQYVQVVLPFSDEVVSKISDTFPEAIHSIQSIEQTRTSRGARLDTTQIPSSLFTRPTGSVNHEQNEALLLLRQS